jgi:hypothetical protein
MTTTYQTDLLTERYNGWSSRETWSVVLWMMNDEGLYRIAQQAARVDLLNPYQFFIDEMRDMCQPTDGDGVRWDDERVNQVEVNEAMAELIED